MCSGFSRSQTQFGNEKTGIVTRNEFTKYCTKGASKDAMDIIGKCFEEGEAFIPELMLAGEMMFIEGFYNNRLENLAEMPEKSLKQHLIKEEECLAAINLMEGEKESPLIYSSKGGLLCHKN